MHRGRRVDRDELLDYLAAKEGVDSPFKLGLRINSLGLAIQVCLVSNSIEDYNVHFADYFKTIFWENGSFTYDYCL